MLLASYAALREQKGESYYATGLVRAHLYRLYSSWGKPEKAAAYRDRSGEDPR